MNTFLKKHIKHLSFIILIFPTYSWAFQLDSVNSASAEVNDAISISTSFGTYNNSSIINVEFLQGGIVIGASPGFSVIPNTSINVRVPAIAEGDYDLRVFIDAIQSDNDLSTFTIIGSRPFAFNVLDNGDPGGEIPSGSEPASSAFKDVDFGDIDNDGDLDIYSFNSQENSFVDRLLINQGNAQGGTAGSYALGTLPAIPGTEFSRTYDGDLVDLNGDGLLDVIRSDRRGPHYLQNNAAGSFVNNSSLLPDNNAIASGVGAGIANFNGIGSIYFDGVDTADIDNDGDRDIILANYTGSGENLLLINDLNGSGNFLIANRNGDVFEDLIADQTHGAAFGDVDGDGDPDLFITNVGAGQGNRLLINSGLFSGNYVDESLARLPGGSVNTGESVDAILKDIDSDGDVDIFVVDRAGGSPHNNLFWNDGSGNFTDLGSPNLPASLGFTYDLDVADVDFDGDIDIIESPGEGGSLTDLARILINKGGTDGDMLFQVKASPYSPSPQHRLGIHLGDADLDLDLDMISGGFESQGIHLYENDLFDPASEDFDYVFMIDRTASMISGGHDYMTPVKNIAKTILAQKRPDDRIGIVTYEYTGVTPDPLASDPSRDIYKADTLLTINDSVGMSVAQLEVLIDSVFAGTCQNAGPGYGCTSIGQAVRKGLGEVKPSVDVERIKLLVVLTDGRQNLPPSPADVIAGFPSNVHVYTVAVGLDADTEVLADLASLGSGFHQSFDALNMADIFQNIESDATEKQIIAVAQAPSTVKPAGVGDFINPSVIDFDEFKPGELIFEQLLKQGVRLFTDKSSTIPRIADDIELGSFFPPSKPQSPANALVNSFKRSPNLASSDTPLTLIFPNPQARVGMFIGNGDGDVSNAVLRAYDINGNLLGSTKSIVPAPINQFIGLQSANGDIAKVQLDYGKDIRMEAIDDLLFEGASDTQLAKQIFNVDQQDKQLRIALSWFTPNAGLDFELTSPSGKTIPGAPDPRISTVSGSVFKAVDIKGPEAGTWTVLIKAPPGERNFLSIMSSSGLKLSLQPESRKYETGKPIVFNANLSELKSNLPVGLAGASFDIQVEKPNGAIDNQVLLTDFNDGNYKIEYLNTNLSGVYNFKATATLDPGTAQARKRSRSESVLANIFDPQDICDRNSKFDVSPSTLVADGVSAANITISLRNCDGSVPDIKTTTVSFTTDHGQLIDKIINLGNGTYQQTLIAAKTPGIAHIHAIVDSAKLDSSVSVNFITGPVDPIRSTLIASASEGFARADGKRTASIIAHPLDANDNPIGPQQQLSIDFKGPVLGSWITPVIDLGDGYYQRDLQTSTKEGLTSFKASVNGIELLAMPELIFSLTGEELRDSDADKITNDKDNCAFAFNPDQLDQDNDGAGDVCDQTPFVDSDKDGISDAQDNCTKTSNPQQIDTDNDGYGQLCDGDLNNDGSTNTLDLQIYKAAHRSRLGDKNYNPHADFNSDNTINTIDLNIYRQLHRLPPGPSCCGK